MNITFHQNIVKTVYSNVPDINFGVIIKEANNIQQFTLKENPIKMRQLIKDPEHIVITAPLDIDKSLHIIVTTYVKGYSPLCSFINIKKKQIINTTLHQDTLISFLIGKDVVLN